MNSPSDLERVEHVIWKLHESFAQPIVDATNRAEKFRLERTGWGTFELRADLKLLDNKEVELRHMLELAYPESDQIERNRHRSDKPTVFLYSAVAAMRAQRQLSGDKLPSRGTALDGSR